MSNRSKLALAATGVLAVLAPSVALAAVTTFTDRAAFLGAAGSPVVTEDFSSFTSRTVINPGVPRQTGNVAVEYTIFGAGSGSSSASIDSRNNPSNSTSFGPGNDGYRLQFQIGATGNTNSTEVAVVFPTPVTAFGGDFGVGSFTLQADLVTSNGDVVDFDSLRSGYNTVGFVGITSDTPFTRVTFRDSTPADFNSVILTADNLAFAPVPEPTALGLAGVAALGLAARRRRA